MKQAAAKTTKAASGETFSGVSLVALTFLDTTWRMATPVILFTVLGILFDRHFGTKPWVTLLVAVPVGFVFAVLLVKKQLQAVERQEAKKK